MTTAEKLEKAKAGDEYSYRLLCSELADGLYAVAMLTLNRGEEAEKAVRGAFSDGFPSISRINDTAHLRAWLSRELTKNLVAQIKEDRAKGILLAPSDELSRLPSLDRIVCALELTFSYNVHEIALICGMSEETVKRKLVESRKKLESSREDILARIKSCKAPDSLKTEEKPEEPASSEEEPASASDDVQAEEPAKAAVTAEEPETVYEKEETAKAEKEPEAPRQESREPENVRGHVSEPEEQEEETVKVLKAAKAPSPKKNHSEDGRKEIDARMFIGVITAQKIKGREFLQLMGNTRISNSIYREIVHNPNLTKGRLIELLENSSLTSEDYYKMLAAVKQRNELVDRKKKSDKAKGEAGLFTLDQKFADRKGLSADMPFKPLVNTAILNDLSGDDTDIADSKSAVLGKKVEKPFRPAEPSKPRRFETEQAKPRQPEKEPEKPAPRPAVIKPAADEPEDDADELVFDEEPLRERKYKGKEFFIDDDVYYKGVNNGKMIFCAICAVLLFAGSFGIRYMKTGSFFPTESASAEQPAPEEEKPEKAEITSDEGLLAVIADMKSRVQHNSLGYYKTDASPYEQTLTADFCEAGDMLYILNKGVLRAVSLSPDDPRTAAEITVQEKELIGFTAVGGRVYIVSSASGENGQVVTVDVYDSRLSAVVHYEQDGRLAGLRTGESAFTLITALDAAGKNTRLPEYSLDGNKKTAGFELFSTAEGAVCGGITVIGSVSGGEARVSAVLGGYDSYARFEGDRFTLILPDWNDTHIENYRLIGTAAELISSETVSGECWGAECLDAAAERAVVYDSAKGCLNILKKGGDGYAASDSFGEGEVLKGVSFTDDKAYVVTEKDGSARLYCADTTGEIPVPAEAGADEVYTEKLAKFGENLIGLSAEADDSGSRTGLRLTVYGYDGRLSPLRSIPITVDENTAAEYVRYLSGDAEENPLRIAVNSEGTMAAVSCVYFDGISEIERFICFSDNGGTLERIMDHLLYDTRSEYRYCAIRGETLYAVTDKEIYVINKNIGQ